MISILEVLVIFNQHLIRKAATILLIFAIISFFALTLKILIFLIFDRILIFLEKTFLISINNLIEIFFIGVYKIDCMLRNIFKLLAAINLIDNT